MMLIETTGGVLADLETFMNAAYGYDVRTELVCEEGTMELARPRPAEVRHGGGQALSFPPDWRGRFHEAYRRQAQAWVRFDRGRRSAGGGQRLGRLCGDGDRGGRPEGAGERRAGFRQSREEARASMRGARIGLDPVAASG